MRVPWRCPRCGRQFHNARQWHSCGNPALTELLAAHPAVVARIGGDRRRGVVRPDGDRGLLVLDGPLGALGLGEGDPVDVFLSADL